MVFRPAFLVLIAFLVLPMLGAHTVPTLTVEAEFSATREATLRVNLDPRLFLSPQPTSLPPVPSSWWFDQNEESRAASLASAKDYVEKTVRFEVGETRLDLRWNVAPIDSASVFPLGPNSAEVHLLAEHRGPLPGVPGDFKVTLDSKATVGLILLNSTEGKPERHPQAIFPGESSRAFKLPVRTDAASMPDSTPEIPPAPSGGWLGFAAMCQTEAFRHFAGDHLLLALMLALILGGKFLPGVVMVILFQAVHSMASLAVAGGWLPHAPLWMQAAGWAALAAGLFLAHRRLLFRAGFCFAVAGLCHGLNIPHLHLMDTDRVSILRDAGLIGGAQVVLLALVSLGMALAGRKRRGDRAGMAAC